MTTSYRLVLDSKRRPTLPAQLLREAELSGAREFVAHVEAPGRIVLEDPKAALTRLQTAVAAGKQRRHRADSLEQSLLDDRAADTSLG